MRRKSKDNIKRIGFISTRISGTDGVSLEIEKWTKVLEKNGYSCFYFAGELDRPADVSYFCEEAHFEHPEVSIINSGIMGTSKRDEHISDLVDTLKKSLKKSIKAFIRKYDLDLIIPENALAIPMNIPLGLAITEVAAEISIPVIAHHHDFSWERDRYLINSGNDYLRAAFPPDLPTVQHAVINSIALKDLALYAGVRATVVPNVYDFSTPPEKADPEKTVLIRKEAGIAEEDPLILQPTRIVPRKWIERSIELVSQLGLKRPVLVISHSSGDEGDEYNRIIKEYAEKNMVHLAHLDYLVSDRICTIGDMYNAADFITYPSGYEGFGNAFLETVYYRKPLLVNRYPVFISDIEPLGFDVCIMDGFISKETVSGIQSILEGGEDVKSMVDKNYETASEYFSFKQLEELLLSMIKKI